MTAILVGSAACSPGKAPDGGGSSGIPYPAPTVVAEGDTIAQIGDVKMTTKELEARLGQVSPFMRAQMKDKEQKTKFVKNEIRMELLAQEAWKRKLHETPEAIEQFKRMVVTQLINAEMKRLEGDVKVTDVDLAKAYKARFAEFNKPERVRAGQIVKYVDDAGARAKARKDLARIQKEVLAAEAKNNPRAFSQQAKQHSEDKKTARGGGDLGFFSREEMVRIYGEDVTKYLFDEVEVGDMGIADAPNAVVLFKKTGRRRGVERTVEMVKPQLRGQVMADKRTELFDAFVDQLMAEHGVVPNYDLIDDIEVDTGPEAPPTPSGTRKMVPPPPRKAPGSAPKK